jgi:arginase
VRVELILVPYDSGRRSERMGRGPERLLEAGLAEHLRALGHEVVTHRIETTLAFQTEVAVAFDLARAIAARVRAAAAARSFPLVLAGNCMSALGVVAGVAGGREAPGVVWLDAHGDFNTPDTTTSAFVDGMAGAVLTGRCWMTAAASVPGFVPVRDADYLLIGARDLDTAEHELLVRSRVTVLDAAAIRAGEPLAAALAHRSGSGVYLHVDLDVLDPDRVGTANAFAAPGGLSGDEVRSVIQGVRASRGIAAATVCAYDPAQDAGGRVAVAAFGIIDAIVRAG